jgi:replicative superfamily II helicase
VMQIFGRAGRPQFDLGGGADAGGHGVILTTIEKMTHYARLMNHKLPIESQFLAKIEDHLNAEVAGGGVGNVDEGIEWLSYTYSRQ